MCHLFSGVKRKENLYFIVQERLHHIKFVRLVSYSECRDNYRSFSYTWKDLSWMTNHTASCATYPTGCVRFGMQRETYWSVRMLMWLSFHIMPQEYVLALVFKMSWTVVLLQQNNHKLFWNESKEGSKATRGKGKLYIKYWKTLVKFTKMCNKQGHFTVL